MLPPIWWPGYPCKKAHVLGHIRPERRLCEEVLSGGFFGSPGNMNVPLAPGGKSVIQGLIEQNKLNEPIVPGVSDMVDCPSFGVYVVEWSHEALMAPKLVASLVNIDECNLDNLVRRCKTSCLNIDYSKYHFPKNHFLR